MECRAHDVRFGHKRTAAEQNFRNVPVCTENLNPDVVVMKSAKNGERFDASNPLNRAEDRRILIKGSMRSDESDPSSLRSLAPVALSFIVTLTE
jgi:hypothetical protein